MSLEADPHPCQAAATVATRHWARHWMLLALAAEVADLLPTGHWTLLALAADPLPTGHWTLLALVLAAPLRPASSQVALLAHVPDPLRPASSSLVAEVAEVAGPLRPAWLVAEAVHSR